MCVSALGCIMYIEWYDERGTSNFVYWPKIPWQKKKRITNKEQSKETHFGIQKRCNLFLTLGSRLSLEKLTENSASGAPPNCGVLYECNVMLYMYLLINAGKLSVARFSYCLFSPAPVIRNSLLCSLIFSHDLICHTISPISKCNYHTYIRGHGYSTQEFRRWRESNWR